MASKPTKGYLTLPDGAALPYLFLGDGIIPITVIPGAGNGLTTVVDGAGRRQLYPGYGHGNDQENPDYEVQVWRLLEAIGNQATRPLGAHPSMSS